MQRDKISILLNYRGVYDRNPGSTNTMKFNLKSIILFLVQQQTCLVAIRGGAYITIIHRFRNIIVRRYFIVTIINEVRFVTVLTLIIVSICIRLSNILSIRFSSYKG
jgi:hypothetical protein